MTTSKFHNDDQAPRRSAESKTDHSKTCAYRYRGEVCNATAALSNGTKGEGPWHCSQHFGRRAMTEFQLETSPPPRPWQDVLIDSLIEKWHHRKTMESKTSYRDRIMASIRSCVGSIGRALPYDPSVLLDPERAAIMGEGEG